MCINKRTAAVITPNLRMDVCFVWACICILVRAYECIYIYIFEFAYVAWCLFMPVCLCAHTPLVCLSALVTVFVRLWSCWNGTWTSCHQAEFTETGLGLACRAVFRLCIYALDNHSNLYHRLVIHVCLLCSALIRFHQEAPFLSFTRFLQKCSRHCCSEFHQPPLVRADQACSGFHRKDVTLKLTTSIIIHPYFSNEFV